MKRRDFLGLGIGAGLTATLGLRLGRLARAANAKPTGNRACILLYMAGGPSQLETFDPKPGTPSAAGLGAISTTVSGMRFHEHLPLLAKQAKHLAVLRSIVSKEGNHQRARHLMHTGHAPAGGVDHPAFASIVSAERPRRSLPSYVSIGGPGAGPGFLGAAHGPFPVGNPARPIQNLHRHRSIDTARDDERLRLWHMLQSDFAAGRTSAVARGHHAVAESAFALSRSPKTAAFDVAKEPKSVRDLYGNARFAVGCLMARRLVEAGVSFVEVNLPGWDTHQDNAGRTKKLCAELDRGMSSLLADLHSRGLLDTTLVVWAGDFGRTPWLNARGGRDHYPRVTPAVLAGGGVRGGQVIGQTDKDGRNVTGTKHSVADVFASIAHSLAIDPDKERTSRAGRPIATVDGGTKIQGLF